MMMFFFSIGQAVLVTTAKLPVTIAKTSSDRPEMNSYKSKSMQNYSKPDFSLIAIH